MAMLAVSQGPWGQSFLWQPRGIFYTLISFTGSNQNTLLTLTYPAIWKVERQTLKELASLQASPGQGCRGMARDLFPKLLPSLLRGLREWTLSLRLGAARALRSLLLLAGDAATLHLPVLLPALCSAAGVPSVAVDTHHGCLASVFLRLPSGNLVCQICRFTVASSDKIQARMPHGAWVC